MAKINKHLVDSLREEYLKEEKVTIAKNAVTNNGIFKSAEKVNVIGADDFIFSIDLENEPVSNQNRSGRCWLYACLNTIRIHIEKQYNIQKFELSQNYMNFWDKFEKANYFYENILETAKSPLSDETVRYLLGQPQQDGGDWDLIVSLIEKYGVVPKEAMPETSCSIDSSELNTILNKKLQIDAIKLREFVANGTPDDEINTFREKKLREVFRILVISLGLPPKTIDFTFRTKDKKYESNKDLTPLEFYKDYVGIDVSDYVGVINVPTEEMPFNKLYELSYSDNMVDGLVNQYLNIENDELKKLALEQIKSGEPVWFGCDVLQTSDRVKGVMAHDLYDFDTLFGIDFSTTKGERFNYHNSLPTHAMVISGVDLDNGKPTKWKVENSWGAKVGDKGFFVMDDVWFDEFVFEVAIKKSLLSKEQLAVLDSKPVVLPFWNGMNPIA